MESKAVELTGSDVTVEDGDTAIIDFVGKLNGVAFDGGTASNYELEIGSGSFIDGFEDGLIGVKKGDTVDLNLTFPESYQSTELAGKDVVFTVTVNGVKRKPQLNDEWLAANTNYATLAEFAAETKQKLEDAAETTASNTLESSGLDQVISNSTVKKYYKSLIEQGESQYEKRLNAYASAYGKSLSELLAAQGMTESQYQNQKQKQAVSYAQVAMVVYAIAQDAGLSEADAEYQTILNDLANNYNMDAATFSSTYGESLVKSSVMSQYAMNYIVSNANVTTQEVEETEETTTAAE